MSSTIGTGSQPGLPSLGGSGTGSGGSSSGALPSLGGAGTGQQAAAAGAQPAAGSAQVASQQGEASGQAGSVPAPGGGKDLVGTTSQFRWLGPAMALGGAGLAIWGFRNPAMVAKAWPKALGLTTAASGVALTGMGFKAHGIQAGQQAGFQAGAQHGSEAVQQGVREMIQTGQLTVGGGAGANMGTSGQDAAAAGFPAAAGVQVANPGMPGSPVSTPGATAAAGSAGATAPGGQAAGATGAGVAGTSPAAPGVPTSGDAPAVPAGQWSPVALVGQAVKLDEARTASGGTVAEAGNFAIVSPLGEANGYASFAEADAAARAGMSTELQGTKLHRWIVVEHAGRFYAFDAVRDESQAAPTMPAQNGQLVGWHALRYVQAGGGAFQWMSYDWTPAAASFAIFDPARAGAAATTQPVAGQQATPSGATAPTVQPVAGQQATPSVATAVPASAGVAGGGAAAAAALVGSGFDINDATAEGRTASGGFIQLQKLVPLSSSGFGTPAEAAAAARQYRAAELQPTQYQRWVTVRAADSRYYVFAASIVNARTQAIPGGSAPMHVFGHGFAEHFDGRSWRAVRD